MPLSIGEFSKLVEAEHGWLRARLGLKRIALEVVLLAPEQAASSDQRVVFPWYGGEPRRIYFPMSENDLSVVHQYAPTSSPPTAWERRGWEDWRAFLWHEVGHQVQDEAGFGWDPRDGRGGHSEPSWSRAIRQFAKAVGCARPEELHQLLESEDTGRYTAD